MTHAILFAIISLLITTPSFGSNNQKAPKYSEVKKMSPVEVEQNLTQYIGKKDTWKDRTSLVAKAKKLIPFQKKPSAQEEKTLLSYTYSSKNSGALNQYAAGLHQSKNPEIKGMIAEIQGDKRLVYNTFTSIGSYDLKNLLFFFKTLEFGDTGIEKKRFQDFSIAFSFLSYKVRGAFETASKLNMPLILEFESSALSNQSPLTKLFFNTLMSNPEHILKVSVTPDGGRVIAIHPFYAKQIVENLSVFTDQFELKVKTLRKNMFEDPKAKQQLIDLLRSGEGFSGLLYTDERIKELVADAKRSISRRTCGSVFN